MLKEEGLDWTFGMAEMPEGDPGADKPLSIGMKLRNYTASSEDCHTVESGLKMPRKVRRKQHKIARCQAER